MGFVLPEGYNPLFTTAPRLGARVDPRTDRSSWREWAFKKSPAEEQMHPAAGYYGETSRGDILRARQNSPVFTIESGYDPVNLLDPEPQQDFRHRLPARQFIPGHQRTPELMSSQFYPAPTISHLEQEALSAENANRTFKQGVRNRLMPLMMGRMNR